MNSQLKDFILELVHFRTRSNTNYKTEILDESLNCTLHPSNFIIHTGYSEYIPAPYLSTDMINVDIDSQEITQEFTIPLIYRVNHTRENDSINRIKRPHTGASNITMRSKSYESKYYFNNGMIMTDEEILFCAAIKTEYIKETFRQIYSDFSNNKFFQLLIENDLQNSEEAEQIMSQRITESLRGALDLEKVKESLTVFINEEKLKTLCREKLIDYDNAFGRNSPWGKLRCIRDNIGDWFNSKVFVEPNLPSFQELDGPEKYLMEKLHEDIEENNQESDGEDLSASDTEGMFIDASSYDTSSYSTGTVTGSI